MKFAAARKLTVWEALPVICPVLAGLLGDKCRSQSGFATAMPMNEDFTNLFSTFSILYIFKSIAVHLGLMRSCPPWPDLVSRSNLLVMYLHWQICSLAVAHQILTMLLLVNELEERTASIHPLVYLKAQWTPIEI